MKINLGVIFGGRSVEHEVSVLTALQAIAAADREKYDIVPIYITKDQKFYTGEKLLEVSNYKDLDALLKNSVRVMPVPAEGKMELIRWPVKGFGAKTAASVDVVLTATHGTHVEDGTLQGFLEYMGVPYTGCNVFASASGMDKWIMKSLFKEAGLPVAKGIRVEKWDYYASSSEKIALCEKELGYPIIVKPVNLGSSVGITLAADETELREGIENAFELASVIICEKAVSPLREINCAVLGDAENARASQCEEPVTHDKLLTYADKYQGGSKAGAKGAKGAKGGGSKGMSGLSRIFPAPITAEQESRVKELAVKAFKALGASGVARVDFLLNAETGELFVNEINTIPGSLSFYLWEPMSFTQLIDELVSLALKRNREDKSIHYSFNSNLLGG